MTKPKIIAFRPTQIDQALIDALIASGNYKDMTALVRASIQQLALVKLDTDVYTNTIADGYENEVMPS